MGYNINNRPDY